MKKSLIAKIISIILILILIIGTICLIFIPQLYDYYKDISIAAFNDHNIYYKIAFYMCYIISLFVIYNLTILFSNIYNDSPFKKNIENKLKIVAILFMLLFLIVTIKILFIPTLLSFAVSILTFIASLSFYVLAEVIKAAIAYKNELDYTI